MIRQSSLYQETIDLRSLVEKEFLAIRTVSTGLLCSLAHGT